MTNEIATTEEMIERHIAALSPEDIERARIAIARSHADLLHFAHLCPKGICRRAGKCSADPDGCTHLLAPFVPEPVHEAVAIMFQSDRLTYDEVRARAPFQMQAYEDWLAKIRESERASAPFLRPKSNRRSRSREQP